MSTYSKRGNGVLLIMCIIKSGSCFLFIYFSSYLCRFFSFRRKIAALNDERWGTLTATAICRYGNQPFSFPPGTLGYWNTSWKVTGKRSCRLQNRFPCLWTNREKGNWLFETIHYTILYALQYGLWACGMIVSCFVLSCSRFLFFFIRGVIETRLFLFRLYFPPFLFCLFFNLLVFRDPLSLIRRYDVT